MEHNQEQGKQTQAPKVRLPVNQLEQIDTDHALATALQEQESAFTMLETIDSEVDDVDDEEEEEDTDEEVGSSSSHNFDGDFESQEFEAELEFIEDDEGSYYDDELEEDEIDPDEMSYEELIALGEIVGEASRGLSAEEIATCFSPYVHKCVQCKTIIDRCVVCQMEYEEDEQLVALKCDHPFHTECINQWLQVKKVCPICSIEVIPKGKL